jgi:hypothetical protein
MGPSKTGLKQLISLLKRTLGLKTILFLAKRTVMFAVIFCLAKILSAQALNIPRFFNKKTD